MLRFIDVGVNRFNFGKSIVFFKKESNHFTRLIKGLASPDGPQIRRRIVIELVPPVYHVDMRKVVA